MTRVMMSPHAARRRHGQRGQVVLLVALTSVFLLSASALAVDLSAQGSDHRILQNWTDAAAIAGARDCDSACNATTEVEDALQVILQNSPWSANTSWAPPAPFVAALGGGSCTASRCMLSSYPGPAPYGNYTVSISSPPVAPHNAAYNTTNYVEVDVSETSGTNLAAVMGAATTVSTGHSVAMDSGPPGPYQYSFYSKTLTGSGNNPQVITGDAYLGDGYVPQTGNGAGKDGLCINEIPGPETSANDTDGDSGQDSDADDQGRAVFDAVPPKVGPEPAYLQPNTTVATCPNGGQVNLQTGNPPSGAGCPVNSTAKTDPATGVAMCYQPPPAVPNIPAPTVTASLPCAGGTATITPGALGAAGVTAPNVYSVGSAGSPCAVTINFCTNSGCTPVNLNCVSLVLSAGSSVNVVNKKSTAYMTSYGYSPDSLAASAFTADSLTEPAACPGAATSADKSVIWAPDPGPVNPMPIALENTDTGCCSDTLFVGTVFLPDQQINFSSNQSMEDVGSVYCGQWDVQSGNHPNPIVTYDPAAVGGVVPILRLVE